MGGITINGEIIVAARTDVQRLDHQLAELRDEEERCQLKRIKLETERSRIQAFVEMCELAQCYGGPRLQESQNESFVSDDSTAQMNGVRPAPAAVPDEKLPWRKLKPDDTPPLTQMIVRALEDGISHGHSGLRPRAMADFVRRQWWPDATNTMIGTAAWRMAREGRLARNGGVYSLNGHG